jgi:catechol 2,3-dioxygenase-like lactoylglutathione lyase family enzyme
VLGRFLEYSIVTADIQASLDFYTRLGFSQAEVGETYIHPYAVVTDGRLCIGLHQAAFPAPSLTFVKPELLKHLSTLEQFGIEFEFRHLGNDVFNEVGWFDSSGELIKLIEARTFSPGKRIGNQNSRCGYFLEVALPTPDRNAANVLWEHLGFVGLDEPDERLPHISCTSDTIDIGLYDPADLRRPCLRFEADDVRGALAQLAEKGIAAGGELPRALRGAPAAMLTAPEGTLLLITEPA